MPSRPAELLCASESVRIQQSPAESPVLLLLLCPFLSHFLAIQEDLVDLLEAGPLLRVPPPAAQHKPIDDVWAHGRLRKVDLEKAHGHTFHCV